MFTFYVPLQTQTKLYVNIMKTKSPNMAYFINARVMKGMTQAELAKAAGVGRNAVINWEAGRSVRPSTIMAIRKVLET